MRRSVVVLLGLVLVLAPALPTLGAPGSGQDGDRAGENDSSSGPEDTNSSSGPGSSARFEGEHLALTVDPGLPGIRNLTLAGSGALVFEAVELPGNGAEWRIDNDSVRIRTSEARFRAEDVPELATQMRAEDGLVRVHVAPNVTIQPAEGDDGDAYRLTPASGPALWLAGENLTRDGDTIHVAGDAFTRAADGSSGSSGDGSQDGNASDRPRQEDQTREEAKRQDRSSSQPAQDGGYRVGPVRFTLSNDTIQDLTVRGEELLSALTLPGLRPAEQRQRAGELRLDGEDARLELRADGGLLLRATADAPITARLAPGVEVRTHEDAAFLSTGSLLVVAQGDDLDVRNRTLTADEDLRLVAKTGERPEDAVWRSPRPEPGAAELPVPFDGRFLSFTLNRTGLANLSVHGTPVGSVGFDAEPVQEVHQRGAQLTVEGEAFELHAVDAPTAVLRLEARNLTAELPARTTLPSGAVLLADIEEDELRLRVHRPADVLSNRTAIEHPPATVPVQRTEGPQPGLRTRSEGGELGITIPTPSTLATRFQGELNGTTGNVSLNLSLTRAMLIDDTNGNGRVDVGEPALASRALANGTAQVEGDALVSTFALWSGNLTVTVEPGDRTAKLTYEVHNLSAPPGTLFVLESEVGAPPGARLEPTDAGVVVRNGSLSARYAMAGPVTVDGHDAWAQRSIFVDSNDTVRVLLAYPAGDDIVHDPTLAIQSVPGASVVSRIAASPYAIGLGALAAAMLVGLTAWQRRRGPRP